MFTVLHIVAVVFICKKYGFQSIILHPKFARSCFKVYFKLW